MKFAHYRLKNYFLKSRLSIFGAHLRSFIQNLSASQEFLFKKYFTRGKVTQFVSKRGFVIKWKVEIRELKGQKSVILCYKSWASLSHWFRIFISNFGDAVTGLFYNTKYHNIELAKEWWNYFLY